jgi:hypothetical protein
LEAIGWLARAFATISIVLIHVKGHVELAIVWLKAGFDKMPSAIHSPTTNENTEMATEHLAM